MLAPHGEFVEMPRRIRPHRGGRGSQAHPSRRSERWFTSSESSRSTRIASSFAVATSRSTWSLVYAVLCHLLEHRDRLVTSKEMMEHVWGDRFVTPGTLNSRIKALRQALGDDGATQRVIQTVHGRGFRMHVDVRAVAERRRDRALLMSRTPLHRASRSTSAARRTAPDCLCGKRRSRRAAARETRQLAHAPGSRLEQSRVAALADGNGTRPHAHPIRRARAVACPITTRRKSPSSRGCATWKRSGRRGPRTVLAPGNLTRVCGRDRVRGSSSRARGQARAVWWLRHGPELPVTTPQQELERTVDEPDSRRLGT